MADDGATTTASDAAQRAAEQARARKERREAKIRAGGSARLSKITGMGARGGDAAEPHPDPDVVDISQRSFAAAAPARPRAEPGPRAAADDPLVRAMAQMMGGAAGGAAPLPPALAGMFPPQPAPAPQPDRYGASFRLVHALLALGLGLYVALLMPFAGTSAQRERAALDDDDDDDGRRRRRVFFWIFATGEALLLTTRFVLDKGRPRSGLGILRSLVGHLPEPSRGYLTVGLRYAQIFTTVRADILLCIFVLGVCAWCKS